MSEGADKDSKIDVHDPRVVACIDRYWRKNVGLMIVLLCVWAIAGLGCGVIFADALNEFAPYEGKLVRLEQRAVGRRIGTKLCRSEIDHGVRAHTIVTQCLGER